MPSKLIIFNVQAKKPVIIRTFLTKKQDTIVNSTIYSAEIRILYMHHSICYYKGANMGSFIIKPYAYLWEDIK